MVGYGSNKLSVKTIGSMGRTSQLLSRVNNQLSSGLRINSAGDDPAALAVAMSLSVSVRIGNRAAANVNDGISALQIADGALAESSSVLARLTEIAEQAANGSFGDTQRSALNQELKALSSELLRIRGTVQFNGQSLLQGGGVTGTTTSLAGGSNTSVRASEDGRYVTYVRSGSLYQQDTLTGSTTTISTSVGTMAVTSRADYVAYTEGTVLKVYDRLSGTSSTLGTFAADQLAISDDGSTIAGVGRSSYSTTGTYLGTTGATRNLTVVNRATASFIGDGGVNAFTPGSTSLTLSSDGSAVAFAKASTGAIYYSATSTLATGAGSGAFTGVVATKLRFDADNNLVALSASNVSGLNSSGLANLYKYKVSSDSFSALTSITSGSGISTFFMTDNGTTLTFASAANLVGQNSGGQTQIYKSDFAGSVSQLTSFTGGESANLTEVSGDGYTLYTSSASELQARSILGEFSLAIDSGDGATGIINATMRDLSAAVRGRAYFDVSTQRRAKLSLDTLRLDIDRLATARGIVGSGLARLETAFRSTQSKSLEYRGAYGRIQDIDVAESVSEQTRLSILQNVQTSILGSTAKLEPQIALSLLVSAGNK